MASSDAQTRVQNEAESMLSMIEREQMRPLQREAYICASRCCEDGQSGTQSVQSCINQCFVPAQRSQDYVNQEINKFQERLTRCAKGCQDKIQDKISVKTSQVEASKLQGEMNACVDECCDSHSELLPKMFERIKETLLHAQKPMTT